MSDLAALAKGGRTNFFGFLLRLAARLPFLFIAGRMYGAETLGRFAYAIIVVEFAAQLATLGLKRGLAQQLAREERPDVHVIWDGMLVGAIGSAMVVAVLVAFPALMFPNSFITGLDRLLPLIIFAIVGSDIALAALAYRHDIAATVRARSIVEPWTISIGAFAFAFYSTRDGLILSYVVSLIAALAMSIVPLIRTYGRPREWRPKPIELVNLARHNIPLAGADAIEWGSRRLDLAILGLFFTPAVVGIYYVAQQVASLPQKLKTSFDPILGPVITRNLAKGDKHAVARQVAQVGFWIIAAQVGIALALGIPGEGVMGLVGPNFVPGVVILAVLLAVEAVAATAAVSEAALVYIARHRNLMISLLAVGVQVAFSFGLILVARREGLPDMVAAAAPALGLLCALGLSSIVKARLLSRLLGAPVSGWRWALLPAVAVAVLVGMIATRVPEWGELAFGVPAILLSYGIIIWYKGFGPDDRVLFRMKA